MRKHDVTKIHLKIDEVSAFHNEQHEGLCILWSSDIGFGEYNLYKNIDDETDTWHGDSECMDSNEDKEFIKELMNLFIQKLVIS